MSTRILITGVSGTGKTTLGKSLQQEGCFVIDIDEVPGLCGWKNNETGEIETQTVTLDESFTKKHTWTCDENKLEKLLEKEKNLAIVIGMPENILKFMNKFDHTILLSCDENVFVDRILTRTNNDFGKEPSQLKSIRTSYKSKEAKILKNGAIKIDANESKEKVVTNCIKLLREWIF